MIDCLQGSHVHHANPRNLGSSPFFSSDMSLAWSCQHLISNFSYLLSISVPCPSLLAQLSIIPNLMSHSLRELLVQQPWNSLLLFSRLFFSTASSCIFPHFSLVFFCVLNSPSKSKFSYPRNTSPPFLWFPFLHSQWQVLPHFHTQSHHNSLPNTLPLVLQSLQCSNLTGMGSQNTEQNHSWLCFHFRRNRKK